MKFFQISTGNIDRETEKAVLVSFADVQESVWLPKSQIDVYRYGSTVEYNTKFTICLPYWLARNKGLLGNGCFELTEEVESELMSQWIRTTDKIKA